LLFITCWIGLGWTQATAPEARFTSIDVMIDPRGTPLAAYQVEFAADPQRVTLVGIEGGDHPAFRTPPFYDPAALAQNRVILAAFDTGANLPTSRTRVARLHLRLAGAGDPVMSATLQAAGDPQGRRIRAEVSLAKGDSR
jgi:hypothetical protein